MSRNADNETQLRNYLLGELGEEEQQHLEEQLLFDDERIEWLLVVEEELIDRYLRDQLSASERARFETYFLSTPARHQKLLAAKALRRYIATTTTEPETRQTHLPSWWQRLFTPLDWKLAAVAALLLLGLGLGIWRLLLSSSQSQVDEGLALLQTAYREQRPIEARVSGFNYAPWGPQTRGRDQATADDVLHREQAARILSDAVIKQPTAKSYHGLGEYYLLEQKIDSAIEHLDRALKADPSNARILSDLGAARIERGKIEQEKAKRNGQDSGQSAKDFGLANEHFDQALQIDGKLAEALFNQALCYEHLQLTQQAMEAWKKYLQLDAQSPWADEANRHLKQLEEQKKKTAWDKDRFWQDFLAYQAEEEKQWETFNLSREIIGNFITAHLLDDYLQFSDEGRHDEARQRLAMLVRVGEMEAQKVEDVYTRDLASFYQQINPKQRSLLIKARESFKAGYAASQNAKKKEALDQFRRAGQMFAQAGSECEVRLADYLMGVMYAYLPEQQPGIELAHNLASYAAEHNYRWLRAQSLCLLANLYLRLNEYSRAITYSEEALAISEKLHSPNDVLAMLGQLATEYTYLGDCETSLNRLQRGLQLVGQYPMAPARQWPVYSVVSDTFRDLNLPFTAIAFQKEALHLATTMNRRLQMSRSHNFLGEIYGKLNDDGEAIKQFEKALEISRSVPGDRDAQDIQVHSLLRLGHIHRKRGNLVQALSYYDQSARFYEQMNLASSIFDAHRGKLLVYLTQGDEVLAQKELEIAQRLFEKDRGKIADEDLRNSFFDAGQEIYDLAIQLYAENPRHREQAFEYSERSRARSLHDLMQTKLTGRGVDQTAEPKILSAADPLSLSEIQRELPPSVQIVQYAVLSEKLYIWVVSKSAFHHAAKIIRLNELNTKVSAYLNAVKAREPEASEAERLARELYSILIKPVESFLEANNEICFVPDEMLNALPFGALIEPASGKHLIEKYTFMLSPSSTVFLACTKVARTKQQQGREECLSVGDPWFDHDRFPNLRNLPSTGVEAERVAAYYHQPRPLLAGDALESVVRREMQNVEIIHLASHGLINEQSPGYSGIVLAKESSDAEPQADGFLQAREISRLKLPRAKLVVLSACETWIGRNYRGEGMVGLARAFLAAEVPLVVASLWAVNDETTRELMESFHRHRTQNKLSTAQALRKAQLEMLHHTQAHYHKPSVWAAFVTIGGYAQY